MSKFVDWGFPSKWSKVLELIDVVFKSCEPFFWGGCVRRLLSGESFEDADCDIFFDKKVSSKKLMNFVSVLKLFFEDCKIRNKMIYGTCEVGLLKINIPSVGDFDLVHQGSLRESEIDFDVNSLCMDFCDANIRFVKEFIYKSTLDDKKRVRKQIITMPEVLRNIRTRQANIVWGWETKEKFERTILQHIMNRFVKLQKHGWTIKPSNHINLLFDKQDNDTCPICLDDFITTENSTIPIGLGCCCSRYHCECLTQLLSSGMSASVTCPVCRTPIKPLPWFVGFTDFEPREPRYRV